MKRTLIADSDFFIALYRTGDMNWEAAQHILASLSANTQLSLLVFVFGEVVTVLSQRVSRQTARHFIDDIEEKNATVVQTDTILFEEAKSVYRAQTSKNVSFTDCANIAYARIMGIEEIISFDEHYPKNGLALYRGESGKNTPPRNDI